MARRCRMGVVTQPAASSTVSASSMVSSSRRSQDPPNESRGGGERETGVGPGEPVAKSTNSFMPRRTGSHPAQIEDGAGVGHRQQTMAQGRPVVTSMSRATVTSVGGSCGMEVRTSSADMAHLGHFSGMDQKWRRCGTDGQRYGRTQAPRTLQMWALKRLEALRARQALASRP